jgi:hypothetical protein
VNPGASLGPPVLLGGTRSAACSIPSSDLESRTSTRSNPDLLTHGAW